MSLRPSSSLAQNATASAASRLFADIARSPAVQSLARRLENGGALSCAGVSRAAQPFFAVLLQKIFPNRPILIVAEDLKTQESFQQDIETWLQAGSEVQLAALERSEGGSPKPKVADPQPSTLNPGFAGGCAEASLQLLFKNCGWPCESP